LRLFRGASEEARYSIKQRCFSRYAAATCRNTVSYIPGEKIVVINKRSKFKLIGTNCFLFAILYGSVTFNKEVLQPAYGPIPVLSDLLGCLPNFLAAALISLSIVNALRVRMPRHGRLIAYAGSLLVFAILTLEELKPMWGASTYYDPLDILASALGALVGIVVYEVIRSRQRSNLNTATS
jgi:hypothetical protein